MNKQELSANDGQEGRPAHIAYQGKVYDVSESRLWRRGVHVRRHHAGNDLTPDMAAAPHGEEVLERVPLVGELEVPAPTPAEAGGAAECEEPESRWVPLLDFYFEQHPHPVAVHFPVALSVVSAIFVLLYLITNARGFETAAYYVLWVAAIMGPVSIATGAFSWWLNYGHKFTSAFRAKIGFSLIYTMLSWLAVFLRATTPDALVEREAVGWFYALLVLGLAPVVTILGRVGANILFPPKR